MIMRSRDTTSEVTCMSHETFAACCTRGSVITSACKKTVSGIGHLIAFKRSMRYQSGIVSIVKTLSAY